MLKVVWHTCALPKKHIYRIFFLSFFWLRLKLIPNIKIDIVEKCAGHGGTFGLMKTTHDIANKVGKSTANTVKRKNNKYLASDCPLAGKHLKQLEQDTKITNDEALHPIELLAKAYKL